MHFYTPAHYPFEVVRSAAMPPPYVPTPYN